MGRKEVIRPRYDAERHLYRHPVEEKRLAGFSEIAKAQGMMDFSAIPAATLNRGRDVGTAVHLATAFFDKGTLNWNTIGLEVMPYLEAYMKFREATGFVPEEIEMPVANLVWGYACTPDRRGRFRGQRRRAVVEFKKAAHMEWHHVQNEAQAACFPDDPQRLVLELMPTAKWKIYPVTPAQSRYYRSIWQSAVQVYHFTKKGDPNLWRPN